MRRCREAALVKSHTDIDAVQVVKVGRVLVDEGSEGGIEEHFQVIVSRAGSHRARHAFMLAVVKFKARHKLLFSAGPRLL